MTNMQKLNLPLNINKIVITLSSQVTTNDNSYVDVIIIIPTDTNLRDRLKNIKIRFSTVSGNYSFYIYLLFHHLI